VDTSRLLLDYKIAVMEAAGGDANGAVKRHCRLPHTIQVAQRAELNPACGCVPITQNGRSWMHANILHPSRDRLQRVRA